MSNLIKSGSVISLGQHKSLMTLHSYVLHSEEPGTIEADEPQGPDQETVSLRDQILTDAKAFAEEQVREAGRQSEQMLAEAEEQIDAWWLEKRLQDEEALQASKEEGFAQGIAEGSEQARQQLQQEWQQKLEEASAILKAAYEMREQIIQESEPFLVELSCAISEKVIGRQLADTPAISLELIGKSLSRRREQGVITLCVAPEHFAFVQAAREELNLAIDSQAELQILPDAKVKDFGCVIRSSFGSVDARIDTQLTEIKRELIQLAHHSNEERGLADERN
ncbi:FliH/SctL family protein [Paenibacillus sp. NPDC058071]|uniref:FliH/SctL family protein n=1 Tax=Paenibacillus sp. NPDC058071 TaxID=3346326 RepID=UPI0036DEBD0B